MRVRPAKTAQRLQTHCVLQQQAQSCQSSRAHAAGLAGDTRTRVWPARKHNRHSNCLATIRALLRPPRGERLRAWLLQIQSPLPPPLAVCNRSVPGQQHTGQSNCRLPVLPLLAKQERWPCTNPMTVTPHPRLGIKHSKEPQPAHTARQLMKLQQVCAGARSHWQCQETCMQSLRHPGLGWHVYE